MIAFGLKKSFENLILFFQFSFFEEFSEDYEDVTDGADYSTTDEENAKVRTRQDLRPQEQRALSADPSRSHKQLSNAMKERCSKCILVFVNFD